MLIILPSIIINAKENEEFKRQELPINMILVIEVFDVYSIDFIGLFERSHEINYIIVAVDYVSK